MLLPFAVALLNQTNDHEVLQYLWESPLLSSLWSFQTLLDALKILVTHSHTLTSDKEVEHVDDILLMLLRSPATHALYLQLTPSDRLSHLSSLVSLCSELLTGTNYLLLNELCMRPYH